MRTESKPPGADRHLDPVCAALDDEQVRARLCAQAASLLRRLPGGRRDELAGDLAQEAMARAVQNRGQYDPAKGAVASWLGGILNNVVRDYFRDAGRRRAVQAPGDLARWERLAVDLSPPADSAVGDRLDAAAYLARLTPGDRELVKMRYWEGLDSAAIAARLGVSPGLARVRLCRTLDGLREPRSDQPREVER